MTDYKKYLLYFIIFLILGEIIHNKLKNKKEEFTNYNELPHLTNLDKSQPRRINSISYQPETKLQPIIIRTKVPTLKNGELPRLGFYGTNSYASKIPVSIIRKYVLPIEYSRYETSEKVLLGLKKGEIQLGLIRDYNILSRLRLNNKNPNIKVLVPMYYETVFFLTSKELKDLSHFQMINLIVSKPVKLFTTTNDKPLLDIIINICKIDATKLEIYVYKSMEDASLNFILNPESILFTCCHFKNGILQKLLKEVECLVLPFIPTYNSLIEIGGYNQKNPVNDDKINALLIKSKKELNNVLGSDIQSVLYSHNLSKNILKNRNNNQTYKTIKMRLSMYISNLDKFNDKQLKMLSSNMIEYYQTMGAELNKWNTVEMMNNNDEESFNLEEITMVTKKLEIEDNVKNCFNVNFIN